MPYKIERTQEFKDQYIKLTRRNKALRDKLDKKILQVVKNPVLGEPKSYNLKYTRGTHVDPYVIVYMIFSDTILFLYVDHHNCVYEDTPKVFKDIEIEFPELWAKMPPELRRRLKG